MGLRMYGPSAASLSSTIEAEVTTAVNGAISAETPVGTVYYVNTETGSNGNDGLTPGAAKLTLSAVYTLVGNNNATIRIHAPITAPLREQANFSGSGQIVLEPTTPGAKWYHYASTKIVSGWVAQGGGVYKYTGWGATDPLPVVTTLTETIGGETYFLRLTKNTGTPTTPSAGQYGHSGSDFYVRLPSDANPASHTIEASSVLYALRLTTTTGGRIRAKGGRFAFGRSGTVAITTGNGTLDAEDCHASFATPSSGSGFAIVASGLMRLTRCKAYRNGNDGFNVAGTGSMILDNCEGVANDDEGASPHNTTYLRVIGGEYRYNGYSGIAAVGSAFMRLENPSLRSNHRLSVPANEGGLTIHETVTAEIRGIVITGDAAPGAVAHTTATVTKFGVTSSGNTGSDNWALTP